MLTPPQSVVQALQVLEVREQLERNTPDPGSPMDQGEKALLREMCNVSNFSHYFTYHVLIWKIECCKPIAICGFISLSEGMEFCSTCNFL